MQIRLLPIFTEHGQVGMALRTTMDRGQSVSFARWVKPRRTCEIARFGLRNSSALLEARDVTRKMRWRSLSTCFYESAPIIQLSRAHENVNIHLGNPLQPTSQIDPIEMHSGFIMHGIGICTSKTAYFEIMFGKLLYQVVHPVFIVWGSAFLDHPNRFTIVFAVLSWICHATAFNEISFTCLAFWLCENM